MSDDTKKSKTITLEAVKSGFVVCTERIVPGKIQDWHAFSTVEDAIVFIENTIGGEDN